MLKFQTNAAKKLEAYLQKVVKIILFSNISAMKNQTPGSRAILAVLFPMQNSQIKNAEKKLYGKL